MSADESQPTAVSPQAAPALPALELLVQGGQQLGITLTPQQIEQFARYYQALLLWNDRFNLTAITDDQGIQVKHFLDCLLGLRIVSEEKTQPSLVEQPLRCLDVGTGAGFPGVPLKIALPRWSWTLMDGTGKKVLFLRELINQLGLADVTVVQGRAEELGRQSAYREQFDLVTARAVAPLNILVEYLLPLTRQGGWVMVYKGGSAPQEFMEARKAIEVLGGEAVRLAPVQVPFLAEKRFILLLKKKRPTPALYPRTQGLSRKKPIG